MKSEYYFQIGFWMIVISVMGLFLVLPIIDNKISEIENTIDNKTRRLDALDYNMERSSYSSALSDNHQGTLAILQEFGAGRETVKEVEKHMKGLLIQAIEPKYFSINGKSLSKEIYNELKNKSTEELAEINKIYTKEMIKTQNIVVEEKKSSTESKNFWEDVRDKSRVFFGSMDTIGLLFLSIANWKTTRSRQEAESF